MAGDGAAGGEASPAHGLKAGLRWLDHQGVGEGMEEEAESPRPDVGNGAQGTPIAVAERMERVRAAKALAAKAASPDASPVASPPRAAGGAAAARAAASDVRPGVARQTSEEEDFRI